MARPPFAETMRRSARRGAPLAFPKFGERARAALSEMASRPLSPASYGGMPKADALRAVGATEEEIARALDGDSEVPLSRPAAVAIEEALGASSPAPAEPFELGACPFRRKRFDPVDAHIEVRFADAPQKLLGWVEFLVGTGTQRDGVRGARTYPFANNPEHPDWKSAFGAPPQLMIHTNVLCVATEAFEGLPASDLPAYRTQKGAETLWRFLAVDPDTYEWLFDRKAFLPADESTLRRLVVPVEQRYPDPDGRAELVRFW